MLENGWVRPMATTEFDRLHDQVLDALNDYDVAEMLRGRVEGLIPEMIDGVLETIYEEVLGDELGLVQGDSDYYTLEETIEKQVRAVHYLVNVYTQARINGQ